MKAKMGNERSDGERWEGRRSGGKKCGMSKHGKGEGRMTGGILLLFFLGSGLWEDTGDGGDGWHLRRRELDD